MPVGSIFKSAFLCSRVPAQNQHWNKSTLFLSCKWRRPCPKFTACVPKFRSADPKMNVKPHLHGTDITITYEWILSICLPLSSQRNEISRNLFHLSASLQSKTNDIEMNYHSWRDTAYARYKLSEPFIPTLSQSVNAAYCHHHHHHRYYDYNYYYYYYFIIIIIIIINIAIVI